MQGGLEQTVDQMDAKRCAETIKKYPEIIVGVKTAHYWRKSPGMPNTLHGLRWTKLKSAGARSTCP